MSKLDDIEALAKAAGEVRLTFKGPDDDPAVAYICAVEPFTIQSLIFLCRQMRDALEWAYDTGPGKVEEALAAFEEFDKW